VRPGYELAGVGLMLLGLAVGVLAAPWSPEAPVTVDTAAELVRDQLTRWGWGGGWGGLLGLVVLLLLVAGVALVVLGLSRRETQDTALDILRQRLARGEITPEQYEELRKLLR